MADTTDYLLRRIPKDLQERVRIKTLMQKTTIRRLLLRALIEFDDAHPLVDPDSVVTFTEDELMFVSHEKLGDGKKP